MLAYIVIEYPERRIVYAYGEEIGQTNTTIEVQYGEYTFDLGKPLDYDPPSQTVIVKASSAIRPLNIIFERKNS